MGVLIEGFFLVCLFLATILLFFGNSGEFWRTKGTGERSGIFPIQENLSPRIFPILGNGMMTKAVATPGDQFWVLIRMLLR